MQQNTIAVVVAGTCLVVALVAAIHGDGVVALLLVTIAGEVLEAARGAS